MKKDEIEEIRQKHFERWFIETTWISQEEKFKILESLVGENEKDSQSVDPDQSK